MAKEMLINVSEGEECRIALLENGRLEELYMERTSSTSHVGNIYKGKVTNVEASIQAAFVDFGLGRNGFLHISDLMPTYFGRMGDDIRETVGKKMARRDRPPIQRCLRRGDEIIVQIIKEGIGTKGPTLSSYLSIPGKFLVMMPGVGKMGVSQKIEDEVERRRLRQILDGLKPPKDVGFIIRTAGVGKSKLEIERDLKYLTRLWETLEKKRLASKGAAELYAEGDLVTRTVRDFFSADIDRILVDNDDVAERVREVIKITTPRAKNKVELYDDPVPMFHKYGIEREIELMYSRHVPLPSGGSLVIDSTEAIVAIDVNSGKFREHNDAELTAFKTDMEAADEIPRQLKLRDLGGVIICDFIDLRYERHRRDLEKKLHDNFKNDRAKTKVLRMSQFGIIEMTRQRMRPSLKRSIYFDCPHCKGAGLVKTPESMSLDVMRRIRIAINDLKVERVELAVCPDVAFYLQNKKRVPIAELERHYNKRVLVRAEQGLGLDEMRLELYDNRDGLVMLPELDAALSQPPHKSQLNTRPHGQQGGGGGRGGQQGGGRFDARRDQGRRGPQQGQQRRGGGGGGGGGRQQQGGRRDEEETHLVEERFDYDDEEQELQEASAGNGGENGNGGPERQEHRNDRGGDRGDRGAERGGSRGGDRGGDRGGQRAQRDQRDQRDQGRRDQRDQRDQRGDQGRRDQRDQRDPQQREPQQRDQQQRGQQQPQHQQNRGPGGPAGGEGFNENGGEGGEGGEGGRRRRRRRRRGRRGRGRGQGQPGEQQGLPQDQGQGEGLFAPAAGEAHYDDEEHDERDEHAEHDEHGERAEPVGVGAESAAQHDDDEHEGDDDEDLHETPVDHSEPLGDAPTEIVDEDDEVELAEGETVQGQVIEIVEVPVEEEDEDEAEAVDVEAKPEPAAEPVAEAPAPEEKPARGRKRVTAKSGGGSSRAKKPTAKSTAKSTGAKAEKTEPAAEAEADEDAPKKRRRGSRGGRGRGKKAAASESAAGESATPAEKPAPARRTSTDRHLMNEDLAEPDPEPVQRPRSRRDLDALPDDYDDR